MSELPQFSAKSAHASQLRARKYALVRRFGLPENLLGGGLRQGYRRCGKPTCHCARGRGHPAWTLTSSDRGTRLVVGVPDAWRADIEQALLDSRAYLDAVREVMAINAALFSHTRGQKRTGRVRGRTKNVTDAARNDQRLAPSSDLISM